MNDDELKASVKEALKPVYELLVSNTLILVRSIEKALPSDVPVNAREKIIDTIVKSNGAQLEASFKQAVPADFEQKLKEELDKYGTKS